MESTLHDLRYAIRSLCRSPGLTAVILITLTLGIGANTAIFSVIDGVLLRPLPFDEPGRLVIVFENDRLRGTTQEGASGPDFLDWQARTRSFTGMAAMVAGSFVHTGAGREAERLVGYSVSHGLFSLLGVEPIRGRSLSADDDAIGAEPVVVLAHAFWLRAFGGREDILGEHLELDGVPYTVVGIMPPGFAFPDNQIALWVPLFAGPFAPNMQIRGNHSLLVVARLAPGIGIDAADEELAVVMASLEEEYPDDNNGRGAWCEPLHEAFVGRVRPALFALLGAVGLVLLIACANVANLLLSRASRLEREVAVRAALGASRRRLLRQFVTESLLLALAGGALGIAFAFGGLRALLALAGDSLPRAANVGIDTTVLLFTLGLCVATGLLFGMAPAVHVASSAAGDRLREGSRGGVGPRRQLFRRTLVVAELALAVLLLVGAGLLLRSFWRLQSVDPGFVTDDLVTMGLQLPEASYPQAFADFPDWPQVLHFQRQLEERIASIPGVTHSALALNHPLQAGWTTRFTIEGRPAVDPGEQDEIRIRSASPAYFRTAGIPILRGRSLEPGDDADAPLVAVVNEAVVRRYFPDEDPLGQRINLWGRTFEIVGVAGDVKFRGLDRSAEIALYPPLAQVPFTGFAVVLRSTLDEETLAKAVRHEVAELDPDLPVYSVQTLETALAGSLAGARFNMTLLSIFAALALLMASIGIYGVISYAVVERTHEIGLRMSLGARRGQILGLVVSQGLRLTATGLALGLTGAVLFGRILESLLFGVGSRDLWTLATVALLLAVVALAASLVPARRASRVDPVVALRHE